MARNEDRRSIRCSFCGKPQSMVEHLIAGNNCYICDDCVRMCASIIDEEEDGAELEPVLGSDGLPLDLRKLPKPMQIKARLDEYVIGQEKAKIALSGGACTEAVEKVIEANTLLSGIGFESGGLAGAHAIHNGLTVLPECHAMQHGEKVNFGTLTQLVLENIPEDDLADILGWMVDIGLPVTLGELGITDLSREHLMPVAEAACAEDDTLHNLPVEVTPEKALNAILAADQFGRAMLED